MKCKLCGKCCSYICLQLDDPEDKDDIENIRWYLVHQKVKVYVDLDHDWYLQVFVRCKELNKENKCNYYLRDQEKERPKLCKTHAADTCENSGCENEEVFTFNYIKEFDEFLKEYNPYTLKKKRKTKKK